MPGDLIEAGFDKQILPRFRFKHRISVAAVPDGAADMALGPGEDGVRVFGDLDGKDWRLAVLTDDEEQRKDAETFLGWLRSVPGRAAIEGFAPDGAALFTTEETVVETVEEEVFEGDQALGAKLAILHCGRCHVVDQRNPTGGIGSTPSFGALRARGNWSDLFRAFFSKNPHPSFTEVEGVTEPFGPQRPVHIAPVKITLEEIEAITAFVATLEPKQLGRPVQAN